MTLSGAAPGSQTGIAATRSGPNRRDFIAAVSTVAAAGLSLGPAWAAPASKVLVVGDSLSAEYGLKRGTGWVALLQQRLATAGIAADVVNASISGDTTSGGRTRLPALLKQHRPTLVVIELGGNDALRGLPLGMTQDNLNQMVSASKASGAQVLLLGMQVPPNYGGDYTRRFAALFETVAKAQRVPLVPFFLKGVADHPQPTALFQPDRIHPNEKAQAMLLDNVWPELKKLLKSWP